MAARTRDYRDYQRDGETQEPCARGGFCSARVRDDEGTWHPAPAAQHLCPADQREMAAFASEIPRMYRRLEKMSVDPVRRTRPVRVTPGSRVLVSGDADALMRDMAAMLGTWAARVRDVPQLSLSRPRTAFGTAGRVTDDCGVLAGQPSALLALPPADALRTWWFHPPRHALAPPRPSGCRRCGLPVSPSPSGKHWWPARCTHAGPLLPAGDRDEETGKDEKLACPACGKRLPLDWKPSPPCRHQGTAPPPPGGPIPAEVEDEIGGLDVVRVGYDWVQALTPLGGAAAGLDVIDLRTAAVQLLLENPAPRDMLDGVPCRRLACEAFGTLEVLPAPQADPEKEAREGPPPFTRCAACGDVMTRKEYGAHVTRYATWAPGSGIIHTCRHCQRDDCGSCQWKRCRCRAADPARHTATAA
jgi:hypothetical protein